MLRGGLRPVVAGLLAGLALAAAGGRLLADPERDRDRRRASSPRRARRDKSDFSDPSPPHTEPARVANRARCHEVSRGPAEERLDRFAMLFVALFAAAGLVTAATGVYALLAYTVAQRRREIAVRMAIGASSFSVARLIVRESLMLALVGCVVGALGVAAVSRLARSVLFGIAPQDPLTLATTAAVLLTAVLAASWLPARRAARINPVAAMRI